jgi:hypothetical protein
MIWIDYFLVVIWRLISSFSFFSCFALLYLVSGDDLAG